MTLLNLKKLPTASLGGTKFLYQGSSVTGGRKTVTHEYPNTGTEGSRFVEDLGSLDDTFSIEAIIDINTNFNDLKKFESVLKKEGIQQLVHPLYGNKRVVVKGFDKNDSIRELGFVKFNLSLEQANLNKFPKVIKGSKGFLSKIKDIVSGNSEGALGSTFKLVKNSISSFTAASEATKSTIRELQRIAAIVEGNADAINDLTTSANEIADNTAALINSPTSLASKFSGFFSNLEATYNNPEDLVTVTSNMFAFSGSTSTPVGTSTVQASNRSNQQALDDFVYTTALGIGYNASVSIVFNNTDQLNAARALLEQGFAGLPSTIDRATLQALTDARIEANNIFDNLSLNLARILTITTNPIPLTVLSYDLYGNLDNSDQIIELNSIIDPSAIEGNVKVLSS